MQPDERYIMDATDPLAGTWRINDTPTMTGWDFTGSNMMRGDVYFIVEHDQGVTKFTGLNVTTDPTYTNGLAISYWPLDHSGYDVYDSANGGWNYSDELSDKAMPYDHSYNQTIKIMSTNWANETTKNYVTAWLNANATKIS